MSNEQILAEVSKYPCELVVLTGGEPSLFVDKEFIAALHRLGKEVAVESNGTHNSAALLDADFVTISPKFEFCKDAKIAFNGHIGELKVVYTGSNDMRLYEAVKADYYYLQPCDTKNEERNRLIMEKCVDYCLAHPKWRLSLQTQKILNVR